MNPKDRAYEGTFRFAAMRIFKGKHRRQWEEFLSLHDFCHHRVCFVRAETAGTKQFPVAHLNLHVMSNDGLVKTKWRVAPGSERVQILHEAAEVV